MASQWILIAYQVCDAVSLLNTTESTLQKANNEKQQCGFIEGQMSAAVFSSCDCWHSIFCLK